MDLFISGQGAHTYRIPALLRLSGGRLLAFCEARRNGREDWGFIEIVVRYSDDEGMTWSDPKTAHSDPPHTVGNPCPVQAADGRVILMFNHNPGDAPEAMIQKGLAPRDVWVSQSADGGQTFSMPVKITDQVMRKNWRWHAAGPGHALRLNDGTLLFPCDYTPDENVYCAHIARSKDGQTFTRGAEIQGFSVNECMAAQFPDGEIYLNMRSFDVKMRKSARSFDGGLTFTPPRAETALPDPCCQGSVLYAHGRLFHLNNASMTRDHLTLRQSFDKGETFQTVRMIREGPSAYSDMCPLQGGVGILYERGEQSPYEKIAFEQIDIG